MILVRCSSASVLMLAVSFLFIHRLLLLLGLRRLPQEQRQPSDKAVCLHSFIGRRQPGTPPHKYSSPVTRSSATTPTGNCSNYRTLSLVYWPACKNKKTYTLVVYLATRHTHIPFFNCGKAFTHFVLWSLNLQFIGSMHLLFYQIELSSHISSW